MLAPLHVLLLAQEKLSFGNPAGTTGRSWLSAARRWQGSVFVYVCRGRNVGAWRMWLPRLGS